MKTDAAQLTEAELTELVISAIEAFQYSNGAYLEREHCALARKLGYNEGKIAGFWRDAAGQAQENLATIRAKLAGVGARFDALRPKIEEAKRKLAEPKVIPYRRLPSAAMCVSAGSKTTGEAAQSSILPASQPAADAEGKDTRQAIVSELIHRHLGNAVPKPEPEEEEPEVEPEEPEEPREEPEEEP